jgi:hypothetical protein
MLTIKVRKEIILPKVAYSGEYATPKFNHCFICRSNFLFLALLLLMPSLILNLDDEIPHSQLWEVFLNYNPRQWQHSLDV